MLKRGATFKQKNNWKSGQFVLGYREGESGVFRDEMGSVFNILLFYFVFNTFQATLERIIHIRKLACALGRVIATKDTPPAILTGLVPWLGNQEQRLEAPAGRAMVAMGLHVPDSQ